MPKSTRADLEKEIAELKIELAARTASLAKLALDDGMMIVLPKRGSKTARGAAPHFMSAGMTEKDQWESVVIPVLAAALMEHGVPVEHTGHRRANGTEEMVELGRIDWHGQQLEFVIVPKLVGRFIAALLDGTASFASQCYERRASDSICSVPP